MIELMWLISWEKMRQQAQQVKIGSLLPELVTDFGAVEQLG